MNIKTLHTPVGEDELWALRAGDVVELSGDIITARDAAHKRLTTTLPLPFDLNGAIIFYAGPCPAKPGEIIGSVAPTTSARMDVFLESMYKAGVSATIGKGERSEEAAALCKQYRRVYFLSFGGAAALIAEHVKQCTEIAYADLGAESVKRLRVEKLRLITGIDSVGNVFETAQRGLYRI
jgi:fumarate hydratase subunit beta